MNPDAPMDCATAPKRNSKRWSAGAVTWQELKTWVDNPADRKECGNYFMGRLMGDRRVSRALISRSALTLDVDYPKPGFLDTVELVLPSCAIAHTTYSSTPEEPRYRLIIPFTRDASPEEYHALANMTMDLLGREQFDPSTDEPVRYMFKPSTSDPRHYRKLILEGEPMDVDEMMQSWDPDLTGAPLPKPHQNKRDPLELEGVVGAFNRVYTIEDCIEVFQLPYERVGAGRWKLEGAISEGGMGLVGDSEHLSYSHHVTDPTWGVTCSAFDLVRLHRFAELDDNIADGTPVNRRPSHQAMLDLAAKDQAVVADTLGVDFQAPVHRESVDDDTDADPDDAPPADWRLSLTISPRTGKVTDTIGNWDLIVGNDDVFKGLYFNLMTLAIEVDQDMPWRTVEYAGATFSSSDRSGLAHYIERQYGIRPARALVDELVEVTAQARRVHPVRKYLESLKWDGVDRLETCLPGVRPTPFTRIVARKSMVAAAARAMSPGIKWDHTLVIYGSEGLGKSWWIDRVSKGFSATLGRITDKDTLLTMRRSWIMVSDEGYSLRKADVDQQKEFLTRTEDVFRMPYDREAQAHPRHNVIWGTTNDEVFLRRQEGNRRFLIVHAEDRVDFDALTDEYVDQLWAEAVYRYFNGELLYLVEDERELAADERERFTEEDALVGLVQRYLDSPVHEDWDTMSTEARQIWLRNRADNLVPEGTKTLTRVSTIQLWAEALGRNPGEHRRMDLLELGTALRNVDGWVPLAKAKRDHVYGPQTMFIRDEDGLI